MNDAARKAALNLAAVVRGLAATRHNSNVAIDCALVAANGVVAALAVIDVEVDRRGGDPGDLARVGVLPVVPGAPPDRQGRLQKR
jgi:hypothetical protein